MAPFQKPINGRAIAKFFPADKISTFRMQFKQNKTVVEFNNKGNRLSEMQKYRPIGVLDLHSIGYYKVNYQRLIAMAEGRFDLFHYCKRLPFVKDENAEQYHRMSGSHSQDIANKQRRECTDPYPWLASDDPHQFQTDHQILYEKIDLSHSHLTSKGKAKLMKLILRYRDAFSLRDEIGTCPNLTADIKVIDESPFFVRPFSLSETDKGFMDEQMEKLVSLGILSKTVPVTLHQ